MDAIDLLQHAKLSVTEKRKNIINLFLNQNNALSHAEIEIALGNAMDRVTIYRTLNTFMKHGLVHQIPSNQNSVVYALCKHNHTVDGEHSDNHVHFICQKCHKKECIDNVTIPTVTMPAGYQITTADMVFSGVCSNCTN